jgi:hypothetical protein
MSDQPKATPDQVAALTAAIKSGDAIVCYSKCWPCQFGQCSDGPHTWMDDDDREHAGIPAPTGHAERAAFAAEHPCGCHCNAKHRGGS